MVGEGGQNLSGFILDGA